MISISTTNDEHFQMMGIKLQMPTLAFEAESIAYTVCQHYGIDTSDYSFGYIAAWGSGKNTPELKSSLETIRSTANEIITQIDGLMPDKSKEKSQPEKQEQTSKPEAPEKSPNIIGNTEYKDIADKNYFKFRNPVAVLIAAELEKQNISYSGRTGKEFTTLTVGGADIDRFKAVEKSIKAEIKLQAAEKAPEPEKPKSPAKSDFIVNTKYADIEDKKFFNVKSDIADKVSAALEFIGVKFSGKVNENNITTFTVSAADTDKFREAEKLANAHKIPPVQQTAQTPQKSEISQKGNIIGNAKYTEIEDKKYFKIDTDIALKVAAELESKEVKFSGRIMGDKTTLTIGNADVPAYRTAYKDVKAAEADMKVADKMPEITREQLTDRITKALEYGKEAFHDGKKCVPAHDENFLGLIKGLNIGEGGAKIADAWLKGWTSKNLSAEIPDKTYTFGIYQVNNEPENRDLRFATLKSLEEKGLTVNHSAYDLIFTAETNADGRTKEQILEDIYDQFNIEHPKDFKGHSLSVSDIVVLEGGDGQTVHYCDNIGFREIEGFFTEKAVEADKSVPTVDELKNQVDNGQSISLMDLAEAVKNEKKNPETPKKKLSIHEQLTAGAEKPEVPQKSETAEKTFPAIYFNNLAYAREHGEIEAFKQSKLLDLNCAADIEKAISANSTQGPMAGTQYVDTEKAMKDVIEKYGSERVKIVTANIVSHYDWDGRLSGTNKNWAKDVPSLSHEVYVNTHLTIFNGFADKVRNCEEILAKKTDIHDKMAAKKSEPAVKSDGVKKSKGDVEI